MMKGIDFTRRCDTASPEVTISVGPLVGASVSPSVGLSVGPSVNQLVRPSVSNPFARLPASGDFWWSRLNWMKTA